MVYGLEYMYEMYFTVFPRLMPWANIPPSLLSLYKYRCIAFCIHCSVIIDNDACFYEYYLHKLYKLLLSCLLQAEHLRLCFSWASYDFISKLEEHMFLLFEATNHRKTRSQMKLLKHKLYMIECRWSASICI